MQLGGPTSSGDSRLQADLRHSAGRKAGIVPCERERDLGAIWLMADRSDDAVYVSHGSAELLGGRSRSEPFVDPQLGGGGFGNRLGGLSRAEQGARENEARRRRVICESFRERACLVLPATGERSRVVGITRVGMRVADEKDEHPAEHSQVRRRVFPE